MSKVRDESYRATVASGAVADQRTRILGYLRRMPNGAHAQQVAWALQIRLTSARARLSVLVDEKLVQEAGTVFCDESKRNVTVYKVA